MFLYKASPIFFSMNKTFIFLSKYFFFSLVLLFCISCSTDESNDIQEPPINNEGSNTDKDENDETEGKTNELVIWTHTEPNTNLDTQYNKLQGFFEKNPYIKGISIKFQWSQIHKYEPNLLIDKLKKIVDYCSSYNMEIGLEMIAGFATPQWVMDKGVDNIGTVTVGNTTKDKCPKVWDPLYKELLRKDLTAIAYKFNDNPNVKEVAINGHNYKGGEMHAPQVNELMIEKGYSDEMVLKEWEEWIDFYANTFSNKNLSLTISQAYNDKQPGQIVDILLRKYRDRAKINNCQLDGRNDMITRNNFYLNDIRKEHQDVTYSYEMVGSFMEEPARQGSYEMTVYNARQGGPISYLRLWRRDCDSKQYAEQLIEAWDKYKDMTMTEFKASLIEEGLYKEAQN